MLNSIISNPITLPELLACLLCAMVLGVFTSLVFLYKSRHSAGFLLTLAMLPMAVAVVILLVNGNIGTGVAVAGAFALVRFRSVPGTAEEIAAIFISMALGLALGMGYIGIAVVFFLLSSAFKLMLTAVNFGKSPQTVKHLKITIPENFNYEGLFDDVFEKYTTQAHLETIRTTNMGTLFELKYNVVLRGKSVPKDVIDELRTRNGNLNIVIGDFTDKEML